MQDIAENILTDMVSVLNEPQPQILADELGSSTLNLKIYFLTNTHKHSLLKVSSLAMKRILHAFTAAGISMPDDAREVVFPEGVPIQNASNDAIKSKRFPGAEKPLKEKVSILRHDKNDDEHDLESDDEDIRMQALSSREPEQGQNIL